MSQLNHPGILKLMGYCVRGEEAPKGNDILKHGIVAVYLFAEEVPVVNLTWHERLVMSHRFADLLDYLQHSPLGSLGMNDFKFDNFLFADGHIKISDYDDMNIDEPVCKANRDCKLSLPCIKGHCKGFNVANNMKSANKHMFKRNLFCNHCDRDEEQQALLLNITSQKNTTAAILRDSIYRLLQANN